MSEPTKELDVKTTDAESSTELTTQTVESADVKQAAATTEVVVEPTEKVDAAGPKTLAEAVEKAVDETSEATESSTEEEEEVAAENEEQAGEKKTEGEQPPFAEHPRWKQVVQERDDARKTLEDEKPFAEQQRQIISYCQTNNITPEQFQQALEVSALMVNDPAMAYVRLRPIVDALAQYSGERLPKDLEEKVKAGVIDAETAKEYAQTRMRLQMVEQQNTQASVSSQQRQAAAVSSSLETWEKQKRTSDPDYAKKYPMIRSTFLAMCQAQPPRNAQDATVKAEAAYVEVNKVLGEFLPRASAKKVLTSGGSSRTVTEKINTNDPNWVVKLATQVAARGR